MSSPSPHPSLAMLVLVRVSHQNRTCWVAADPERTLRFAPQVTEKDAIARFQAETGRTHGGLARFVRARSWEHAGALVRELFEATYHRLE